MQREVYEIRGLARHNGHLEFSVTLGVGTEGGLRVDLDEPDLEVIVHHDVVPIELKTMPAGHSGATWLRPLIPSKHLNDPMTPDGEPPLLANSPYQQVT